MPYKRIGLNVLLLSLFLLASCVTSPAAGPAPSANSGQKVKLRMTALSGPVAAGLKPLLAEYAKVQPNVEVNLEIQADEMNWQKTAPTTMFASGDKPDLSWWWCSRTTQYKDMIAANLLEPLDDLYAREGWTKSYPQGTLDFFLEPDGHRYGVNIDVVWTPYIYYNKDIFKKVGVHSEDLGRFLCHSREDPCRRLRTADDGVRDVHAQPLARCAYAALLDSRRVQSLLGQLV